MKWIRYGPDAVLVEFAQQAGHEAFRLGRSLIRSLHADPPKGLTELVPGFTSLLLEFRLTNCETELPEILESLQKRFTELAASPVETAPVKEIPVVYDGLDLPRVAELHGLAPSDVVRIHSQPVYTVYLLGFAPGFPYLGDLDPQLHTPRLGSPRPKVPAGSVAIGGEHTGIYSIESPGGWNIIGRTRTRLFNLRQAESEQNAEAAFFLRPGDRVRFLPVDDAHEGR